MDPIGVIAIVTVMALGDGIETNKQAIEGHKVETKIEIKELRAEQKDLWIEIDELQSRLDKLAASHAAVSARDKVNVEANDQKIKNLQQQLNTMKKKDEYLDKKIQTLHP